MRPEKSKPRAPQSMSIRSLPLTSRVKTFPSSSSLPPFLVRLRRCLAASAKSPKMEELLSVALRSPMRPFTLRIAGSFRPRPLVRVSASLLTTMRTHVRISTTMSASIPSLCRVKGERKETSRSFPLPPCTLSRTILSCKKVLPFLIM